jgi:hypothetical protein
MQRTYDEWVASGKHEMKMSAKDIERRDEAIGADDFRQHLIDAGFAITGDVKDFTSTQEIKEALKKLDYKYDDKTLSAELSQPELGLTRGQERTGGQTQRMVRDKTPRHSRLILAQSVRNT